MHAVKLVSILSVLVASASLAETPMKFNEVDKDADGLLSISEAKEALPDLKILDTNKDGMVSKAEAERSLDGLLLRPNKQGDGAAPVREPEYRVMVRLMLSKLQAGSLPGQ